MPRANPAAEPAHAPPTMAMLSTEASGHADPRDWEWLLP